MGYRGTKSPLCMGNKTQISSCKSASTRRFSYNNKISISSSYYILFVLRYSQESSKEDYTYSA